MKLGIAAKTSSLTMAIVRGYGDCWLREEDAVPNDSVMLISRL